MNELPLLTLGRHGALGAGPGALRAGLEYALGAGPEPGPVLPRTTVWLLLETSEPVTKHSKRPEKKRRKKRRKEEGGREEKEGGREKKATVVRERQKTHPAHPLHPESPFTISCCSLCLGGSAPSE